MIWSRLKSMRCPICNADLFQKSAGCSCTKCEFFIGKQKFNKIVGDLYGATSVSEDPDERLSDLNNFDKNRCTYHMDEQHRFEDMGDGGVECMCGDYRNNNE